MDAFPETPVDTAEGFVGPWRAPRQMLAAQSYDAHASIHDDATAQKLGFRGGTIEGPTHFSQFAPLAVAAWGVDWLARGCISAHYRAPVYEGDEVRAHMAAVAPGETIAAIRMERRDGTEILRGTCSIGPDHPPSALDRRLAELAPLADPVILHGVELGRPGARSTVCMSLDQHMGALYPFTLADKLGVITEPSPLYRADSAADGPFDRAIIPTEMISVLLNHSAEPLASSAFPSAVGLFADQEIRLLDGPLFVGEAYEIDREVVAITGSRRTESLWVRTRVFRPGTGDLLAVMLLNQAILKDSVEGYAEAHARLHGASA